MAVDVTRYVLSTAPRGVAKRRNDWLISYITIIIIITLYTAKRDGINLIVPRLTHHGWFSQSSKRKRPIDRAQ